MVRGPLTPSQEDEKKLYEIIVALQSEAECAAFFHDLCTPSELASMAGRWRVAKLLAEGNKSYRDIQEETGVSLATIGRVARFLSFETNQGYRLALNKQLDIDRHR